LTQRAILGCGERRRAGFTLIEVMVAVAILALSLTAIFSSEAGAAKVAHRSRKMGLATLAARCKMNEIEEQIATEGLPAIFDSGSDGCCEDSPYESIACDWEIEPITLPDTMFAPEDPAAEPGAPGSPTDPALGDKTTGPDKAAASNPPAANAAKDPMAAMAELDPEQALAGGGLGGMAAMALSYAYPVLKPGFEAQIRRATVTVRWKEGAKEHSFDVTQYVVADQPAAPAGTDPNQDPEQQLRQQQLQQGQPAGLPGLMGTQTSRSKATF
jgi:general secretion pathway protein I